MKIAQLNESLPLDIAKDIRKGWDAATNRELFKQWSQYAIDKNNMRLLFPLDLTTRKSEYVGPELNTMLEVLDLILQLRQTNLKLLPTLIEDIPEPPKFYAWEKMKVKDANLTNEERDPIVKNYINGYLTQLDGSPGPRIGKVLNRGLKWFEKLYQQFHDHKYAYILKEYIQDFKEGIRKFESDSLRKKALKETNYYIIVSRHPYDVASVSTGRRWESCLELHTGKERYKIVQDARNGAIAFYMIAEGDWNINDPVSRILCPKYQNQNDKDDYLFFTAGDMYGSQVPEFLNWVKDFIKQLNGPKQPETVYCAQKGSYMFPHRDTAGELNAS